MRLGELCAGYGGLGMAVEEVFNADTAWFSEFDAAPSKILAHHWPAVPNYGDMTTIKWAPDCPGCGNMCSVYRHDDDSPYYWCSSCEDEWDISIRLEDRDADRIPEPANIHSGGTPCQDLSAAGRRAGMNEGTRSNLWVNMREGIAIQRPKYVVWENVRGAFSACASSEMGQCEGCVDRRKPHRPFLRALGRVLGDLSDLGYDTQWRGLRAADVGACHGRFRVFVLAANRDRLGHERARGARNWRTGLADIGQPPAHAHDAGWGEQRRPVAVQPEYAAVEHAGADAADPEGIGWGEGWAESTRFERGLPAAGDSAPTPNANRGDDAGWIGNTQRSQERREATAGSSEGSSTTSDAVRGGSGRRTPQPEQARGDNAALGSSEGAAAADANDGVYQPGRRTLAEAAPSRERADEGASGGSSHRDGGTTPTNWGDYEPAIRRWERVLGRPAPRPTEPTGRNGGHRLSPRFTEWMMGLPDGWVTDSAIGISRNEQLKACGNGVVPQQAMAALRDMLAAFQTAEVAA